MKKIGILVILIFLSASRLFAEEAGTEISVFIPESLYLHDDGSVSMTSGLSTAIGLGDYLEIPIGFDYCKFHGYMVDGATVDGIEVNPAKPWFIADNFLVYLKLQLKLELGPVVIKAFGGGAGSWNATLTPLEGWAADDVTTPGEYAGFTEFSGAAPFGYGWLAGGSFGVKIKQVTVHIFAEYRDIYNPLTLTASYLTGPVTGLTTAKTIEAADAYLLMRGIACGIGGNFSF